MGNFSINQLMACTQRRTLVAVILGCVLVTGASILLISHDKPRNHKKDIDSTNLTGVVDASFSEANAESALTAQQTELESLKVQMVQLREAMEKSEKARESAAARLTSMVSDAVKPANTSAQVADNAANITLTDAASPWQTTMVNQARDSSNSVMQMTSQPRVHAVSFHYGHRLRSSDNHLNPDHYVPSGTFVRAVVLGGADADASVNGQAKNNGVMLFKLLQPGTLPNGQHSHLQGCFVTASSYGDISSERAYVVLDKLSCAQKGMPIIDKTVTGWAFFGGKVGIKGQPLMRDNKVMQWAGISGAMSGIAAAAQYSQSVQSISALGAATTVPSGNIAPYAAYGGASKAAEVLSSYYVKRAEQYHPVIQVGSGNLVTIVFKDGFYLEPDDAVIERGKHRQARVPLESDAEGNPDFTVPHEVLSRIDKAYAQSNGVEQ
ncbi:MAG: conjugal transfer protein TraB [Legionellales bacterium]|nr:conjugal transfer protein TraB [Legionellales bacterium]